MITWPILFLYWGETYVLCVTHGWSFVDQVFSLQWSQTLYLYFATISCFGIELHLDWFGIQQNVSNLINYLGWPYIVPNFICSGVTSVQNMKITLENICVYVWFNNYGYSMYRVSSQFTLKKILIFFGMRWIVQLLCFSINNWECATHTFELKEIYSSWLLILIMVDMRICTRKLRNIILAMVIPQSKLNLIFRILKHWLLDCYFINN